MSGIIEIHAQGLHGTARMEDAYVILGDPVPKDTDIRRLIIDISEDSKRHNALSYTTDLETAGFIFDRMTLRSSSLTNAGLNDPMEKDRVGVNRFAGSRFITCFTQIEHECVPFWIYYGKKDRPNKLLFQFRNFATCLEECIFSDYALVEGKKCLFNSPQTGQIINSQWTDHSIQDEYDLRGIINTVQVFDVEYVSIDSAVFSEDHSGRADIDFSKFSQSGNAVANMKVYDPTALGKQKSNPWDYEKETRILCTLMSQDFSEWKYIDLRLKDEMFRDLKIILSPWDEGGLREKLAGMIEKSSLADEIKNTIEIYDSGLKGKLNFPE